MTEGCPEDGRKTRAQTRSQTRSLGTSKLEEPLVPLTSNSASSVTNSTQAATSGLPEPKPPRKRPINSAADVELSDSSKRTRRTAVVPMVKDWDKLPHNLGTVRGDGMVVNDNDKPNDSVSVAHIAVAVHSTLPSENESPTEEPPKAKARAKASPQPRATHSYGLTPGRSPFPDWPAPCPEACEEVHQLLAKAHGGAPTMPAVIPAPSFEVTGCGEVDSVLDALLRTVLSDATSMANSNSMFQALTKKFGITTLPNGQKSLDWNAVRLASQEEVFQTIKHGGLGNIKSKHIKEILDMVYQENQNRRSAYLQEKETGAAATVVGASTKTKGQKELEIYNAEHEILSLDHIRGMTGVEAMDELIKFPGVGVKTASCVLLFCLQQPSFAVDTHVHRMCRWLGWVPSTANANKTFSHCDFKVPDNLKYGLHQLFIHHGQACGRCRANTVAGTKEWENIICPLEHLLDRGKRSTKIVKVAITKRKASGQDEDNAADSLGEENDALEDSAAFKVNAASPEHITSDGVMDGEPPGAEIKVTVENMAADAATVIVDGKQPVENGDPPIKETGRNGMESLRVVVASEVAPSSPE